MVVSGFSKLLGSQKDENWPLPTMYAVCLDLRLLALKAEFKAATGQDWKPGMTVPEAAPASGGSGADLSGSIKEQGDLVRKLKADKAAKPEIEEAVKKLLALKAEYKAATGKDWSPEPAKTVAPPASAANNSGTVFSTG